MGKDIDDFEFPSLNDCLIFISLSFKLEESNLEDIVFLLRIESLPSLFDKYISICCSDFFINKLSKSHAGKLILFDFGEASSITIANIFSIDSLSYL